MLKTIKNIRKKFVSIFLAFKANRRDDNGETKLASAVSKKQKNRVKVLLDNGANMLAKSFSGNLPFNIATLNNYTEIMDLFIKKDPTIVNHKGREGKTAINIAAEDDSNIALSFLINHPYLKGIINLNSKNKLGRTPLITALTSPNPKGALLLIEDDRVDINKGNHNGEVPLLFATMMSPKNIVDALLEKGADPDIKSNGKDGISPLDIAIRNNNQVLIKKFLLQRKKLLDEEKERNIEGKQQFSSENKEQNLQKYNSFPTLQKSAQISKTEKFQPL